MLRTQQTPLITHTTKASSDMTLDETIKETESASYVAYARLGAAKGKAKTAIRAEIQKLESYLDGLYFKRNMAT
jgi:hypothetical protein